ncbi:MAG TPA: serine hydrolase [Candidatus Binatia bacterium]
MLVHRLRALTITLVVFAVAACGDSSSGGSSSGLRWPGEEWFVSTPEAEGMDSTILEGAREYAFAEGRNTQGVVVVRNGAIVAEWYAEGAGPTTLATSWSMAKSFAGTLIGIAIDRGDIPSLDVPLTEFFPQWRGTDKEGVTLRHLLEMRSGIEWNEITDNIPLYGNNTDQLTVALNRPQRFAPGTAWNYSSADSMLISGVIEAATGRSAKEYAEEHLLGPIGLPGEWWIDASGHALTYCCLDAPTREYARFGLLFARGGEWDGRQVVSREWVEEATRPLAEAPFYGLHWWSNSNRAMAPNAPAELFAARGLHSQDIYVIPSLDLVVVRNGLYERAGTEAVRTGANFHRTQAPSSWSVDEFLAPVLASITDAEPAQVASTASVAERERVREAEAAAGLR